VIAKQRSSRFMDITGQVFGRWTVLSLDSTDRGSRWLCQCECGTRRVLEGRKLREGHSRSCGCLASELRKLQLAGQEFGRLVAIESVGQRRGSELWRCACECGNETHVTATHLVHGRIRSCGCLLRETSRNLNTKHGQYQTPTYKTWQAMRDRCNNPNHRAFPNYGGRGIRVCDEWQSFAAFLEHVGERPSDAHEIDRIDVNGNYEPGNVRWVTRKQNSRNRRWHRLLTAFGETLCVSEWAERMGIKVNSLMARLDHGWDIERALTEPVKPNREYPKRGHARPQVEK
jgi:hypothetical protein